MTNSDDYRHLNPYGYAYKMILDRLKWDLSGQAGNSKDKLKSLKNAYAGKKALILCNGPSLNKVDFSLITNDIYTFGLNKVNLLFDRVKFRPSSIVSVNDHVIEQNMDFFNSTDIPLFIDSRSHKLIRKRENVVFMHSTPVKTFVKDCSYSINQGGTVTFVALQLAFHMGFQQVGMVGCDHYFSDKGASNSLVTSGAVDSNHFDPSYFSGGQKWQLPDLAQSEYSYELAKENFEIDGREIFNCSEGGYLEIFTRKSLNDFTSNEI